MHPEGLMLVNETGENRGFVDPDFRDGRPHLDELWIMQGSICDLKCRHCYVGSSPTNDRLEQIGHEELVPQLESARTFGVKKIYFTGGEVFVNEEVLRRGAERNDEFLRNLEHALRIAPVEILTNGRRYIRNHFAALQNLRERHGDRLTLRITLESTQADEHDAIRGRSTFSQTVRTIRELGDMGFVPVITAERPFLGGQPDDQIRDSYRALFPGMRVEVNLIENLLQMGHELVRLAANGRPVSPEVYITTSCFSMLSKPPETLMCHFSRCIQKIEGRLRYYPCPVIYDDSRYELGDTLEESLRRVYTAHRNCYDYCLKGRGGSCQTRAI